MTPSNMSEKEQFELLKKEIKTLLPDYEPMHVLNVIVNMVQQNPILIDDFIEILENEA
jgi:hypothetical protein